MKKKTKEVQIREVEYPEIPPCHIEALGHYVLVYPDPVEKKTKSGIILAHENEKRAQADINWGTVVSVGPQAWKVFGKFTLPDGKTIWGEPWARVGDRVLYTKYGGKFTEDPVTGELFIQLNDEDIGVRLKEVVTNE